jgi:transcriptional regulator with XRE-family HTH domain
MAAYAGISRQHLSNVEHGKSELCLLALQKIADELGLTMSRLLSGISVPKPDR